MLGVGLSLYPDQSHEQWTQYMKVLLAVKSCLRVFITSLCARHSCPNKLCNYIDAMFDI